MSAVTAQALFPVPGAPAGGHPGHPGQDYPFFIPRGADPAAVELWTDLHINFHPWPEKETDDDLEGVAWMSAIHGAEQINPELYASLRLLRRWGSRLSWTKSGGIKLNWRAALPNVPEPGFTVAHVREVLARNPTAIMGLPNAFHSRAAAVLERYLEPWKTELGRVFGGISKTWPEGSRW